MLLATRAHCYYAMFSRLFLQCVYDRLFLTWGWDEPSSRTILRLKHTFAEAGSNIPVQFVSDFGNLLVLHIDRPKLVCQKEENHR